MRRSVPQLNWVPFMFFGVHDWKIPAQHYGNSDKYTNYWKKKTFDTKSRSQWDYNRIDESINNFSEFRKLHNRPDFGGPRESNWTAHNASMKNPPNTKKLYEYFDLYTKPGSNPKMEAAIAVREQWDADNDYYPGESWEHNRPAFRSVPKEIVNNQTTYNTKDMIVKGPEGASAARNRAWNPMWPPPGYKLPHYGTKREFTFGCEDPGLIAEVERWYWHKMWADANSRVGFFEILGSSMIIFVFWWGSRNHMSGYMMGTVASNQWYPGAHFITSFGESTEVEGGKFWWQTDMKQWPEQHSIWVMRNQRFGYIDYLKRKEALKQAEAAL